ncbi:MAG: YHS domain-containing protein [Ignavibacterium sp.]|jgi:YHS domain-containing protein|nr:YHS domain-containing protein [Ignavibacterium sp.]
MLKQLILIAVVVSLTGVFTSAQDHTTTVKKEKMEQTKDSKSCCSTDKSNNEMQIQQSLNTSDPKIWNKVCPVTGEELDSDARTVEYNGKTIGLCCKKCVSKFEKDPEKYMKNLNKDGSEFIGS